MRSENRLRIVHVTFGLDVGGLEKLLLEIASQADPKQQQLMFVSLGHNGAVGEELRRLGWPVVCMHQPTGFHPGLYGQLRRLFRGARANVVHTHDARALIYGAPAAKLAGVPIVVHTQHGQCLGLSERQVWLLRLAARAVSHYVCVSKNAFEIASQKLRVPANKLHTIYNGIDVERFLRDTPDADGQLSNGPLTTVARLSSEKGIATLLDAISIARRSTPDLHAEIAGDGPCRDELLRQAKQLDIDDCVRFLGVVSDIPALLQRSRLFVLPSHSEGVALTLLEAMAAGVPVLATRAGGTSEVVIDDQTGVLVPPADPPAMARAICRLWGDAAERARLAEAGRGRVCELFGIDRMLAEYESLYQGKKLCAARSPKRPAADAQAVI